MDASEIIIYKGGTSEDYDRILYEAVEYALISYPFTINRMGLAAMNQRIINIAKGKLAEGLLAAYALDHGLDMNFSSGSSPFWMRDLFDFSWKGYSWDVKNNFIYHAGETIPPEMYLKLPAIVPNRYEHDQWIQAGKDAKKAFLFTYMRQAEARKAQPIFSLYYSDGTKRFLRDLSTRYLDNLPTETPFTEDWFQHTMIEAGGKPEIVVHHRPSLVITGICMTRHRDHFADTDGKNCFGYARYNKKWYEVRPQGGLSFMNGVLETKIKNATCPVGFLPGFKSLI